MPSIYDYYKTQKTKSACDGPIFHPEESYQFLCVSVCVIAISFKNNPLILKCEGRVVRTRKEEKKIMIINSHILFRNQYTRLRVGSLN
jgi:hypothetical protein